MICYRDMTFCRGDGCTKFSTCHRALTHEVKIKAASLGLMISQFANPQELNCYEKPKEENESGNMES